MSGQPARPERATGWLRLRRQWKSVLGQHHSRPGPRLSGLAVPEAVSGSEWRHELGADLYGQPREDAKLHDLRHSPGSQDYGGEFVVRTVLGEPGDEQ